MPKQKPKKVDRSLQKANETLTAILTTNTYTDAAAKLQISRQGLYDRIDKYNLQEQLDKIPQEALNRLRVSSTKAAENFVSKIDSRNENVSMEASKEILDRVGVVKPSNTTNNVQVNIMQKIQEQNEKYQD